MLESARTCVGTRATWDGVAKNLMLPQTRAHVTVYGFLGVSIEQARHHWPWGRHPYTYAPSLTYGHISNGRNA